MGFREKRIGDQGFGPIQRVLFARLVGSHVAVRSLDIQRYDVGTSEFLDELADAAPSDGPVEALVDSLADRNCEFSFHGGTYTYCTRIKGEAYTAPNSSSACPAPRRFSGFISR